MEEAPTPNCFDKIKEEIINFDIKKEVVSDKNNKFKVSFSALTYNEIDIKAIHEDVINKIYEKKFKVEDIKQNKYFVQFDDLKEICEELKERITNNKITLLETTNSIIISIPLPSSKIKEIVFELIENKIKDEEKITKLVDLIRQQQAEISSLKKEIEDLKEFKDQFSFLTNCCITNLNSLIITEINDNSILKNWINPEEKIKANLLYRLTRDGDQIKTYHNLCDNKGPTLTLFHLKMGDIVGFMANESIDSTSKWVKDPKCFIFNLSKKIKCKKIQNHFYNQLSFYCLDICGPSANGLGCNENESLKFIYHYANGIDNVFNNKASSLLPSDGVEKKYEVQETEIFQIITSSI